MQLDVLGRPLISKKSDAGELGPFSSTSFQRAFRPVPMPCEVRHEISEVAEPVLGERGPESIECLRFRQAQD